MPRSVPWAPDGTLEWGTYVASVQSIPINGEPPPRPARFEFVLGDFSPPFFDDEDSPHEASIDHVAAVGLTSGCADLQFCPLGTVERWQMALFLTRLWALAGMEPLLPGEPVFTDIGEYPDATQTAIEELAALGITSGVADDLFDPAGLVSRREMALFLDRQGDRQEEVAALEPEGTVTREQMATFLSRIVATLLSESASP